MARFVSGCRVVTWELHEMDCRLAMGMLMDADSVDSIVCDPPYGLSKEPDMAEVLTHWLAGDDYVHTGSGFMGKSWDSFVPGPSVWREAYRVLKPGGHLVAFFGTRTYDLGVLALRLAGFEIRDQLAWVFGSGFPKSHDVSKGIDKALGAERAKVAPRSVIGHQRNIGNRRPYMDDPDHQTDSDEPASPEAAQWQGWGTALKPAYEPIVLARKPLVGTVARNVLSHGTGALNIDGCRVGDEGGTKAVNHVKKADGRLERWDEQFAGARNEIESIGKGRWPANFAHDGSPEVLAEFPVTGASKATRGRRTGKSAGVLGEFAGQDDVTMGHDDQGGSAARFFYCAKASKSDRNEGLDDLPEQPSAASEFRPNHTAKAEAGEDGNPYGRWSPVRNNHATVKPTALMQWLVRLVTPPGGTVLDPFTGSGSTGVACAREGFSFIGCEMTTEYVPIIRGRVGYAYDKAARVDHAVNSR